MNRSASGRTQLLLSLALLALLALLIILQGAPTTPRPYDLNSPEPAGLLALRLWLTEMGYTVDETIGQEATFRLSDKSRLLLIFPTDYPYNEARAKQVAEWVARGGTAVLIGTAIYNEALATHFGVRLGESTPLITQVTQQQPLLPKSPGPIDLTGNSPTLDLTEAPNAVVILADEVERVTAAVQRFDDGEVWHLSSHHIPVNSRLREPAQAALIPMLLRNLPRGSLVQIDTYHLFGPPEAATAIGSVQEWFYYTPLGWALLFLAGLTALTLVLQGQRLGPPLPVQATTRRREAAEYVTAMANLRRRAGQRAVVVQHHKQRLKRALGRRAHVSADLDDATFLHQLAMPSSLTSGPITGADDPQLEKLFHALDHAKDERALVAAVAEVDGLIGTG